MHSHVSPIAPQPRPLQVTRNRSTLFHQLSNMNTPVSLRILFPSLPSLHLIIADPTHSAIRNVKASIRPKLPRESQNNALRLIHAGRVLPDAALVSTALPPPQNTPDDTPNDTPDDTPDDTDDTPTTTPIAKGKAKLTPRPPITLHCAIVGTTLTPSALAAEYTPPSPTPPSPHTFPHTSPPAAPPSRPPSPRGFDRLLATPGFTPADIAALRAQHRATIAARHTPDSMPTPRQLLSLEDAWLSSSSTPTPRHRAAGGAADAFWGWSSAGESDDEAEARRQLADLVWGAAMGFFWPVGAVAWGLREEGVWSRRRKEMVLLGIAVNVVLGVMRVVPF